MTPLSSEWLFGNAYALPLVFVTAILSYFSITLLMRLVGLRSFSKMSSTDFVTTVALGSTLSATITAPSPSVTIGLAAFTALFALKFFAALVRRKWRTASRFLDNDPVYLMQGDQILDGNLAKSNITTYELHAKLREANVWSYDQVISVVLERTGDVSVLRRDVRSAETSGEIFVDVTGGENLGARTTPRSHLRHST